MSLHSFYSKRRRQERGVALILVLSFVVLLTAVMLVFLSRAMTARQLSNGSLKQSSADQLAVSALDIVTASLKQEMAATTDSRVDTYSGTAPAVYTVYHPLGPANVLPIRFGNPAFASPSPDPAPNLIRISSHSDASLPFPSLASAVNSTADASLNGRLITFARWNRHYLLPLNDPAASATDSTPVTSFTAPDWVLVTDTGGPTVLTAPSPNVIGRYAYAIYDEGGLLDVNVAGYPTKSTMSQYGEKTGLAYADLTQLALPDAPTQSLLSASDVDNLVGWRNYASVQPSGAFGGFTMTTASQLQNFFNLVTGNTSGFLTVNTATWNNLTDQAFLSRQQLLQYCASTGVNANALQFLGTFSRDLNAPTWSPSTPASYVANMNSSAAANRNILGVRVITPFVRADGTTAQVGEPLLKYRFPLNRLAGLTYQGIDSTDKTTLIGGVLSAATEATIQRDFGLVWVGGSASHWNYCGPSGSAIQSSIASLGSIGNREPNFFELLKAAILSGSLGRDAGPNGIYLVNYERGPASGIQYADASLDAQIIQLGANIIDQSDTDSYPTEIHFMTPDRNSTSTNITLSETAFYGIENLPYLQRVFAKTLESTDATTTPSTNSVTGWYMAEIWNPHQNFGYTDTSAIPANFRFAGAGLSAMFIPGSPPPNSPSYDLAQSGYLQFTVSPASNTCRDPTLLANDPSNPPALNPVVADGSNGTNSALSGAIEGLYTGVISIPPDAPDQNSAGIQPQSCDLFLEYQAPDGSWRIYDRMRNLTGEHDYDPGQVAFYYQHVDPRTDRFGTSLGQWTYNVESHRPGGSIRPDPSQGWNSYDYFPCPSSGFNYPSGNGDSQIFNQFYMGTLSDNLAGSDPSYADPDGITRPAEGCYATGNDGRPLILGNSNSRPIIINRPFRNVGELGYTFRDSPWKDIDFFSPQSGDAGLLDLFCIQESTTATPMVAGVVNLNTRQAPVLQAILAGAIKNEVSPSGSGSISGLPTASSEAASIANAITNWTQSSGSGQGPFQNRSDLLVQASSILVASNAASADQQIKIRREAALRALSDAGTTRTWTLLIDLIAQVGHYPPGATSLKQFNVDGEKRYWLHISIDRYTGQVIDQVLEPVYE